MVDKEWFWLCKDPQLSLPIDPIGLSREKYPYFMDEVKFRTLKATVAYYRYEIGTEITDFLFWPTFMISDRLQGLFEAAEPQVICRLVRLYECSARPKVPPTLLYWVPFLPYTDCIHEDSTILQGQAKTLIVRKEAIADRYIVKARLPGEEIWLCSLEVAEGILRRGPVGLSLKKIDSR